MVAVFDISAVALDVSTAAFDDSMVMIDEISTVKGDEGYTVAFGDGSTVALDFTVAFDNSIVTLGNSTVVFDVLTKMR